MKRLILYILLTLLPLSLSAQKVITGTVWDTEEGSPMIGATIFIEGSNRATITDIDGKFSIQAIAGEEITVQFMGYFTEKISVGKAAVYSVVLKPDAEQIEQSIVTALGLKRERRSLGYAATDVSGDNLSLSQSSNWLSNMQGKVAGVQFNGGTTGPINSKKVVIRGESSLRGNNSALFVIDGIPMSSGSVSNSSNGNFDAADGPVDYGDGASDINPDDIKSVTVLKGAAATALYGSRAGNGVILITTKSGSEDNAVKVSYSSQTTFDVAGYWPDFQTQYGAGNDNGEKFPNFWGTIAPDGTERATARQAFGREYDENLLCYQYRSYNWETGEFTKVPWTYQDDWYTGIFRVGSTFDNSVTIDAGNGNGTKIRASIKNSRNNWILPNTGYRKNTIALNFSQKASKLLKIEGKINYYTSDSDNLPASGYATTALPYQLMWGKPSDSMQDYRNEYFLGHYSSWSYSNYSYLIHRSNYINPYRTLYEQLNSQDKDRVLGNIGATLTFSPKLTLSFKTGLDLSHEFRTQRKPKYTADYPEGFYREQNIILSEMNSDFMLKYTDEFFHGDLTFTAGFGGNAMTATRNTWKYTLSKIEAEGIYNTENYPSDILPLVSTYRSARKTNSLYGLVSLGWREMAYLDITGRNDWSSTLSPGYWSFFYPSVSSSVLLDKAFDFQKNLPAITFMKVRASWANVGKDTDPYSLSRYYTAYSMPDQYRLEGTSAKIDLRPENVETIELGLEMKFLSNRVGFDLAWYTSDVTQQIFDMPNDWMTGSKYYTENIGLIRNRGVELSVNLVPVKKKDFRWDIDMNISKNVGWLVEMYDGWDPDTPFQHNIGTTVGGRYYVYSYVGERMGQIWARGLERIPEGSYYLDSEGNRQDCSGALLIYDSGDPRFESDKLQYYGNVNPDLTGGFSTSLSWKRWTLDAAFSYQIGGKALSQTAAILGHNGKTTNTLEGRYDGMIVDGYRYVGEDDEGHGIYKPNDIFITDVYAYYTNYGANRYNYDEYIFDTSYLKFKELRLGYRFPKKALKATKVLSDLALSAYATNLFCITAWPQYDPDCAMLVGGDIVRGIEAGAYPMCRSYGFNIKVTF